LLQLCSISEHQLGRMAVVLGRVILAGPRELRIMPAGRKPLCTERSTGMLTLLSLAKSSVWSLKDVARHASPPCQKCTRGSRCGPCCPAADLQCIRKLDCVHTICLRADAVEECHLTWADTTSSARIGFPPIVRN
jgi:hypothetical protein